jgi:hypothetical protein
MICNISLFVVLSQLPNAEQLAPIGEVQQGLECNDFAILIPFNSNCKLVQVAFNTCPPDQGCGIGAIQQFYNCSGSDQLIPGAYIGGNWGEDFTFTLKPSDAINLVSGYYSTEGQLGQLTLETIFGGTGTFGNSVSGNRMEDSIASPNCLLTFDIFVGGNSCTESKSAINGIVPYSNGYC